MPKVFDYVKHRAKVDHNVFDRSMRKTFSLSSGMLLPVFCEEVLPNSSYRVSVQNLLNSHVTVTSPFLRAKMVIDFYHVPYQQLWHGFYQMLTDKDDNQHAGVSFANLFPLLKFKTLLLGVASDYYEMTDASNQPVSIDTAGGDVFGRDVMGIPNVFGILRLLDLLGYGNFLPICKYLRPDAVDLNDYIEKFDVFCTNNGFNNVNVNISSFLAYQKIYFSYYRSQYYEPNDPAAFNIDDLNGRFDLEHLSNAYRSYMSDLSVDGLIPVFSQRYRLAKKDLVTAILPSSQFGGVSVMNMNSDSVVYGTESLNNQEIFDNLGQGSDGHIFANGPVEVSNILSRTSAVGVSILEFRRANALQRFKERSLLAGTKYQANLDSMYGSRSRVLEDDYPRFLGSVEQQITFQDVAGTSENNTGERQSYGYAQMPHREIELNMMEKGDYGLLMGIMYIVPEMEYENFMIQKRNLRSEQLDYYFKDFENLGLEPLYQYQVDAQNQRVGKNTVLGYLPRYFDLKTSLDTVHGEFYRNTPYVPGESQQDMLDHGVFAHWSTPRVNPLSQASVKDLHINPAILNTVFTSQYNGAQYSDQFTCVTYFDFKAIQPMSVLGLPNS